MCETDCQTQLLRQKTQGSHEKNEMPLTGDGSSKNG